MRLNSDRAETEETVSGTFDQVQAVLRRKRRSRYPKQRHAFMGLLTCAKCGCAITAERKKGLKRFTADRACWTVIEVSREVSAAAETLSAAHPLRALDAIHVASAQLFATRIRSSAFSFVSADTRQITAAVALGMTTRHIAS
jgi:predicted nucleic acid-binding protein